MLLFIEPIEFPLVVGDLLVSISATLAVKDLCLVYGAMMIDCMVARQDDKAEAA